jgi:hypothetical protein
MCLCCLWYAGTSTAAAATPAAPVPSAAATAAAWPAAALAATATAAAAAGHQSSIRKLGSVPRTRWLERQQRRAVEFLLSVLEVPAAAHNQVFIVWQGYLRTLSV